MKKNKKISSLAFTAILGLALSFTACDDNDDDDNNNGTGSGTASVGSTEAAFSQGVLDYSGEYSTGIYLHTIALASSGLTYQEESGTGDLMTFNLYTETSGFESGTYEFTNYSPSAGKADYAVLWVNLNASSWTADHMYRATEGTIMVNKDGASYDISFSLTVLEIDQETYNPVGDPQTLTGNYTGGLTYYDNSGNSSKKLNFSFNRK